MYDVAANSQLLTGNNIKYWEPGFMASLVHASHWVWEEIERSFHMLGLAPTFTIRSLPAILGLPVSPTPWFVIIDSLELSVTNYYV